MPTPNKIFIGCPTSSKKNYCVKKYLDNVTNFSYNPKQINFCDNSPNPEYHYETFLMNGFMCDYVSPNNKKSNEFICESQNTLRQRFLESDCTHFFSLEEDLIPPKNIIEILLAENENVCCAKYFIGQGSNSHILAQQTDNTWSENVNRNCSVAESFIEHGRKNTATNYGLGCMMIHRNIMEQIYFEVDERNDIHSDNYFSLQIRELGYEIKVLDLIIPHYNQKLIA